MGSASHLLFMFALGVSRLLDPLLIVVNRVNAYLSHELDGISLPPDWRSLGIDALWVIGLYSVYRVVPWWIGVVLVVVTGLVLAKLNGLLPATGGIRM